MLIKKIIYMPIALFLSGCAGLDFGNDQGLSYFDQKPYLFVSTTKDCVTTSTVISMPAAKRVVKFKSGYGTADLSVSLSNGMITSIGQKNRYKDSRDNYCNWRLGISS